MIREMKWTYWTVQRAWLNGDDDIRVIATSPTDDSPSHLYIGAQRQAYREGAECMEDFSRS